MVTFYHIASHEPASNSNGKSALPEYTQHGHISSVLCLHRTPLQLHNEKFLETRIIFIIIIIITPLQYNVNNIV